jgi:hypothetical protein
MRILILLAMMFALSGCTAMLVGGEAESGKQDECSESEKEAEKGGC